MQFMGQSLKPLYSVHNLTSELPIIGAKKLQLLVGLFQIFRSEEFSVIFLWSSISSSKHQVLTETSVSSLKLTMCRLKQQIITQTSFSNQNICPEPQNNIQF